LGFGESLTKARLGIRMGDTDQEKEAFMPRTVVLVATLDTKGTEAWYLREQIEKHGVHTLVVDGGILGQPQWEAQVSREEVARLGGLTLDQVQALHHEGKAIEVMIKGAARVVQELHQKGKLDGIISLGGSMGTSLGTGAMRALPFGVPKLMVSTMASRDTRPYVGTKDIAMLYSVADMAGLNRMTRRILDNAAGAIVGMVQAARNEFRYSDEEMDKLLIAISNLGTTEGCGSRARFLLEERGYETVLFHTVGPGGQALEECVQEGLIDGVLDISIHEVLDFLFDGNYNAGPDRLEAAGRMGIPQVIAPGNLDFIACGDPAKLPDKYKDRKIHIHNPAICCVRANAEELRTTGQVVAEKLNQARGPVAVVIPSRGFSSFDEEGGAFWELETDGAFAPALKAKLKPEMEVIEVEAHINDPLFAETVVEVFDRLMQQTEVAPC
jgi:uncharacterized protein (UPF0261 family)